MNVLCKPFRCLSFLGGKKPPDQSREQYQNVDGHQVGKVLEDDDDEDDFFNDSWDGPGSASSSSAPAQAEAKSSGVSGVQRNPTRETTTKRAGASPATASGANAAAKPAPKKQDMDLFGELGMEIEYQAPRVLQKDSNNLGALLDDAAAAPAGAGWGDDDLDL
eukprot:TRINITY_DN68290_c0_g1_i1.p1 TRINITY_DN68290_c0_g1~~TRINITY_DN68290_c0_g1_i1.p1  ORF type:complete len:163 (-),score=43.73 TRINITY_DN68290_c0_g1_i1:8-496(-)